MPKSGGLGIRLPKVRVVFVKRIPKGFIGMNYYAAKAHGIPFPYPKNYILVKRGLKKSTRRRTILHEKIELALMRRGLPYRKAHKIALKHEKKHV